ncbi:Lysyl oxidase [Echinococcus granulosus]|uniref:Lysyl oxidase n=1 Tax=Echinococcus granulosus TaxID=6210 RepID=W6UEH2_ECHGR|nr:Lysyl oxidase [Echinococcus granulosus]EUB56477.1 Lysyl oxidase [Echinococcus granulosus]
MNAILSLLLLLSATTLVDVSAGAIKKPVDGDLKLLDGDNFASGTVAVYRGYAWGRVCDDNWSIREANVVCRQLGLGFAVRALKRNKFHSVSGRNYFMDNVRCLGNETRLIDCKFDGWARHDCAEHEDAGVQCAQDTSPRAKISWNPLRLDYTREELEKLAKVGWLKNRGTSGLYQVKELNTTQAVDDAQILIIQPKDGEAGALCPDDFTTMDAIVACKQTNSGIGGRIAEATLVNALFQIPLVSDVFPAMKHVAIIGHCFGNETSLDQCKHYVDPNGVKCKSTKAVAVACQDKLPDLTSDIEQLENSVHIQRLRLWHLQCALEEHCFPDSVYTYIANNPGRYYWDTRTLIRFSSITKNVGMAPFLPALIPEHWEWHPCHAHYHSMKVFGSYEVIDIMERLVSYGHKASFCLEDNHCEKNVTKHFFCSNVMDTKGKQGISPGCQDEYFFNYDCQWVDITDLPVGDYTYQVTYNPHYLVPESNYFNNAVTCKMQYRGNWGRFYGCKIVHPFELL